MALLGEVGGAPHDVVAPVVDGGDERLPLGVDTDFHTVAHGHGVGGPYTFEAEVAFHLAVHLTPIVGEDGVPESCVLDDCAVHCLDSHDLFLLSCQDGVDVLDILVVEFLQVGLSVLALVLRQSVLNSLLQLVFHL